MAPLNKIIIDTDPGMSQAEERSWGRVREQWRMTSTEADFNVGVDDILAVLLALAAKPEELEVLMLSITYGNVEVQR